MYYLTVTILRNAGYETPCYEKVDNGCGSPCVETIVNVPFDDLRHKVTYESCLRRPTAS